MAFDHAYMLAFGAVTTVAMLVAFTAVQSVLSPALSFGKGLARANVGRALLHVGNVVAVFLIGASVVASCVSGESIAADAIWTAAFAALALVAFAASARLGVHALLGRTLPKELDAGNAAAGVAAGGYSIATGIVVARTFGGTSAYSLMLSAVFFVFAQASLHGLVVLFRALTTYDDDDEIRDGNVAAALSYAGVTIAVAIIVGRAVEGPFQGWSGSITGFVVALGYAFVLYPVRQILVEGLLLRTVPRFRNGRLDTAVGRERNIGMGALEAATYVATALVINRIG